MLFVNFKTFEEGSGQRALSLVRIIEEVTRQTQIKMIPVVQAIDVEAVVNTTTLEVWVQHVDPISYGPYTGWILPVEVVRVGIRGVFLNHSEHKFQNRDDLVKAVGQCKEVDLKTLIFASDLEELKKVVALSPTYAAYEPPELIGSTKTSVTQVQPEIISRAAALSKKAGIPLIVGAGVKSAQDIKKSIELGAAGVVVSSAVVKAEDPKQKLMELVSGFR